ncbi:HNH endonuclease signature motif containing protein [Paraburkholderia sp. MPAMCS5]|uniref:HNH endonuclease signature motif containing protein n=1 Tax=Paraburkholderia sp. MPAMCS5 TaxID=3112563 RepID=UPI002E173986|nr:HNH endonuclease signature motif containing protein [Paraburkholderia sp. MPAMCS5]
MWKLPLPDSTDAIEELVTALSPVGGVVVPLSEDDRAAFAALYEAYDRGFGNPSPELLPANISPALAQAVHDGYDSTQKNGRLKRLRERLQANISRCPFCGFAAVTSLDHHLPRSDYKALAVYCRNLIPACGACNQKKGVGVQGPGGDDERFLNAYFYEIPPERFFRADCSMQNNALVCNFDVVQTEGLANNVYERLRYQFRKLELNRRLQPEVTDLLLTLKPTVEMLTQQGLGADGVEVYLRSSAESYVEIFGANHWKTAMFYGLAECAEFCEQGYLLGTRQFGA